MIVVSLDDARSRGLKRYYTGAPCKHGHLAERQVSNKTCFACHSVKASKYLQTQAGRAIILRRVARWKKGNPEKVRASSKKTAAKMRAKPEFKEARESPEARAAHNAYRKAHRRLPEQAQKRRLRDAERWRKDANYRLASSLRTRLRLAIKAASRRVGSAVSLLGCSIDEARKHIEAQFVEGMSWENHGQWHIDHKRPLKHFDLTDKKHLAVVCHYTNLQPLWAIDNIRKGAKVDLCAH